MQAPQPRRDRRCLLGCRAAAENGLTPPQLPRSHGTVKWFNGQKGFGFVVAEDGGKDVFLHISIVDRAGIQVLPEGQQVPDAGGQDPEGSRGDFGCTD